MNDRVSTSFRPETSQRNRQKPQEAKMGDPRKAVAKGDWHGEFGNFDEWASLGPQPPYRSATFTDAQGRRCVTQHDFARARDDKAFPVRYRWKATTKPRKGVRSAKVV